MGCSSNCTKALVPIKWEKLLKVFGAITEVRLMTKCCPKKTTKNNPESAIATFRAIEEVSRPISFVLFMSHKSKAQTDESQTLHFLLGKTFSFRL